MAMHRRVRHLRVDELEPRVAPVADFLPPMAFLQKVNDLTTEGTAPIPITVMYFDNVAVNVFSLRTGNIVVNGPNGFSAMPKFTSVNAYINGTPRFATYTLPDDDARWDSDDNGDYTIMMQPGEVRDTGTPGNFVSGRTLGTFKVHIRPTNDTTPPTASPNVADVTTAGGTSRSFTVTYSDNWAVNVASLDSNDIRVVGPNGFDAPALFMGVDDSSDGTPRQATYVVKAPGGTWDSADNGSYAVVMQPNQVSDAFTPPNFVAAGTLGTFQVNATTSGGSRIGTLLGGQVILYDTDTGAPDVTLDDVTAKAGRDGSVASVTIKQDHAGLGIIIAPTGPNAVTVSDARSSRAGALHDISFIAGTGGFTSVTLKSGLVGWSNTGHILVAEGLVGNADLDGDGLADEATGFYSGGSVRTITPSGTVGGEMVVLGSLTTLTASTVGDSFFLTVGGNLGSFAAKTVAPGAEISAAGNIGSVKVSAGGFAGFLEAGGGITTVSVSASFIGNITTNGTAGIGTVSIPKGVFDGMMRALGGGIKSVTIGGTGGAVMGIIESTGTAGIGTLAISGNLNGTTVSASNTGGAGIKSLTVSGGVTGGSLVSSGAGIGTMTLKGDSNLTINTKGKVGKLTLTGTPTHPLTISGIFDVRVLGSLTGTNADLNGLTIRATDGIGNVNVRSMNSTIFSAGTIGNVTTSKDMTGSMLLAGYDIGTVDYMIGGTDDGTFGTAKGNIGAIAVGGTMSASSIAAGIAPAAGLQFGDGNDTVLVSASLEGAIKSLTVKGALTGSANPGDHFGVVAHESLGALKVGRTVYKAPWPSFGTNLTVQDNITL